MTAAQRRPDPHADPRRYAEELEQHDRGIGAGADKEHVAENDLSTIAGDEVESGTHAGPKKHQQNKTLGIAIRAGIPRQHKADDTDGKDAEVILARTATTILRAHMARSFLPRIPCGRK